ncbi:MaoC/PaaZ C-terminal domain-containing protein [Streptomonospora litoralis]|uniref:Bifunctional enoyl-CoA hydratase/phosphate acetyltransferase n=1 Tax=Streptomonospora litoralis TaxID=2498135 RepID=A0A4P6Q309_9ACTN|nr:MaoC/PaaZ C-terminal domain-containing protein [Streptomonospora litoralis]QBI54923.1 bifunctional enoyl-CoA hydratase/phosphate acetyltransferase [Streptomonospora litoralis]
MTAPRPATDDTAPPPEPAPASHVMADGSRMALHRAALRADLGPASTPEPSPIYPFVLAHPVADATVRGMADDGAESPSVVHLGQEIRIRRLPRPAEEIGAAPEVLAVRAQPGGCNVAVRITLTDAAGEPVAVLLSTVLLSGASPAPFGTAHRMSAPARSGSGEAVGVTHRLSEEWIADYAEASGDRNPIHLDPAAARAAGFDTVIAHGMGVLGLACEEVVDRFAAGSPARVRSIGARFSAPVGAGEPLTMALEPDADPAGGPVAFSCRTGRGLAVKGGWVELHPARGAAEPDDG